MRMSIVYAATTFTFSILAFFYFRLFIVNELNCYILHIENPSIQNLFQ